MHARILFLKQAKTWCSLKHTTHDSPSLTPDAFPLPNWKCISCLLSWNETLIPHKKAESHARAASEDVPLLKDSCPNMERGGQGLEKTHYINIWQQLLCNLVLLPRGKERPVALGRAEPGDATMVGLKPGALERSVADERQREDSWKANQVWCECELEQVCRFFAGCVLRWLRDGVWEVGTLFVSWCKFGTSHYALVTWTRVVKCWANAFGITAFLFFQCSKPE